MKTVISITVVMMAEQQQRRRDMVTKYLRPTPAPVVLQKPPILLELTSEGRRTSREG